VGIRLIVEVLDHWKDFGLTAGERGDLIVIAEHTSDTTRETVVSIHKAYMLQRAGKSAAGWKNAIGKLMKKGVLEHAVRNGRRVTGHENQAAQYRIPHLCPVQSHDGLWGQCKRVTSQVTHSEGELNQEGHPSDDPLGQEGHLSGAKRVTSQVGEGHLTGDPSPSSPSSPSSLSVAEEVVRDSGVVADDERETFINWINNNHNPNGPAWWRAVAKNKDFAALAEKWRADQPTSAATLPPWCGQCGERQPLAEKNAGLRLIEDDHGNRRPCPDCHPDNVRNTA
jgi:hypothetical protein